MARILVTRGVPSEGFYERLAGHELCIPPLGEAFARERLFALLPETDAIIATGACTGEMIEAAPRLQIIACYGAGYDHIDMQAARARGIPVANTPDVVAAPTAELAIALMLALGRRLIRCDAAVRTQPPASVFVMGKNMGVSLDGATLGIVGMGRIGARAAELGRAFGMRVIYHSRTPKPARDALGDTRVTLEELMRQSDFVSVHCPHTSETEGLISEKMIGLMKPTAFFINTARGPVADESALLKALQARRIAGAGLDVFTGEPNVNPAFFTLDNVLLTPHQGSNTAGARRAMAEQTSERVLSALRGETPRNLIR